MSKSIKDRLINLHWNTIGKYFIRPKYLKKIQSHYNYDNSMSLITNNCIGGEIYNDLGLKFTSPTINLFIRENDFLKFASNIKYYLSIDLKFDEPQDKYPIGVLDDIKIHFLHYKTKEQATKKWYERRERIDYENLFVITSDMGVSDDTIAKYWDKIICKRKVMFTTNKTRTAINDIKQINMYETDSYVNKYALNRLNCYRDFEKFFDFVAWFNGEEDYMLM